MYILRFPAVKEFLKSVHIWQRYSQNESGTFLSLTVCIRACFHSRQYFRLSKKTGNISSDMHHYFILPLFISTKPYTMWHGFETGSASNQVGLGWIHNVSIHPALSCAVLCCALSSICPSCIWNMLSTLLSSDLFPGRPLPLGLVASR